MTTFNRIDFLSNVPDEISIGIDFNLDLKTSYFFNIIEDENIHKSDNIADSFVKFLTQSIGKPFEKLDISNIETLFKNPSSLPKWCFINCCHLSHQNIGILSSIYKYLDPNKEKTIIFQFSKTQQNNLHSFEPFQFRDRAFFDLDKDLLTYNSFQILNENIESNLIKKTKKI